MFITVSTVIIIIIIRNPLFLMFKRIKNNLIKHKHTGLVIRLFIAI